MDSLVWPTGDDTVVARCIYHDDKTPSMVIFSDHVICRTCFDPFTGRHVYKWKDQIERDLHGRDLEVEEHHTSWHPKSSPPPSAVVANTYCSWLTGDTDAPYASRLPVLYSRGLRLDTLKRNQIGHNGEGFSIPIYTAGVLTTIRYRRDDERSPERPKYWGTPGHNEPVLYQPYRSALGGTKRVIIVEGELDALRLAQEGYRAVTVTNGAQALSKFPVDLLPESDGYLLCMDEAGWQAGLRIHRAMVDAKKAFAYVGWSRQLGKDVTDFLNRWPVSEFQRYVEAAECVFAESH